MQRERELGARETIADFAQLRAALDLNAEMVELDELDDDDRAFLRTTVQRHHVLTGSTVAERLLADWDTAVEVFRKVMPTDYRRVLTVMREAQADGLDEAATLVKVMGASHG